MYPKVFEDFLKSREKDGDMSMMGSDIFFHGLAVGETCEVKVSEGRELVIKLIEVRDVDENGYRDLVFEVDGNMRIVKIKDHSIQNAEQNATTQFADPDDPTQVGANIPGNIVKVLMKAGDEVEENQPIAVIEAMKMESNILATTTGVITDIDVKEGDVVKSGQLIAVIDPAK